MAVQRICKIEGCDKSARPWGLCLCPAHYGRLLRHGDPTKGRRLDGEAERFYREVVLTDDRGADDPCLIWPFRRNHDGYGRLWIAGRGKEQTVSRILCREVHGEPPTPKHESAHSCGKGRQGCVTKRHLNWKTSVENAADKLIHGTHSRGERSGQAKLTESDVREMRMLRAHTSQRKLAARFEVSEALVSKIIRRTVWAWLS